MISQIAKPFNVFRTLIVEASGCDANCKLTTLLTPCFTVMGIRSVAVRIKNSQFSRIYLVYLVFTALIFAFYRRYVYQCTLLQGCLKHSAKNLLKRRNSGEVHSC